MSLFWLFSLLLLTIAFGVLVWTFVWVARLFAERARTARDAVAREAEVGQASRASERSEPVSRQAPSMPETEAARRELEQARERERKKLGTGVNATLGLILGVVACASFWVSPLVLAVSVAGVYFGGNALWLGLRRFGVIILRAVIGVVLSLASFGLQYVYLTGTLTGGPVP